jgi:hypothetical protein
MSLAVVRFNRIYIDSIDAVTTENASHSNFTVQLPQPLQGNTSAEVENAVISYVSNSPSIPYYMANLYFQYTATADGFTRRYVATIPTNCFYTLTTLVAAVNTSLATATVIASNAVPSDVGAVDDLSPYIVFALNASTPTTANPNKITFTVDAAYASAFSFVPYGEDRTATSPTGSFIYHNLSYRLGYGMPYDIGSYLNTTQYVAAGGSWAYPSIQRTKYLLLTSDFSRQAYSTLGGSKVGRYDVLAKVYVGSANIGDTIVFSSQAVSRYIYTIIPAGSISTLALQVLDDEGELWDCPAFGPGTTSVSLLLTHAS